MLRQFINEKWDEANETFPPPILWQTTPLLRWVFERLAGTNARAILTGVFLFTLYYILPNLVACRSGAGLSEQSAFWLVEKGAPHWILDAAAARAGTPAFGDLVHFVFSCSVLLIGIPLAGFFLRSGTQVLSVLCHDSALVIAQGEFEKVVVLFHRRTDWRRLLWLPLVGFGGTIVSFLTLEHAHGLEMWWAHHSHGAAGLVLSVNIAVVMGLGLLFAELILVYFVACYELLSKRITLRPLHPDGCSGFTPFGALLTLTYVLMLVGGIAFAAVYWFGYFGLEYTLLYWCAVLCYLVVVFAVVIAPLFWFSARIDGARREMLRVLEALYEKDTRGLFGDAATLGRIPPLEDFSILYNLYKEHPLTPFKGRTLAAILGSYVVQVVMSLTGFLGQ